MEGARAGVSSTSLLQGSSLSQLLPAEGSRAAAEGQENEYGYALGFIIGAGGSS